MKHCEFCGSKLENVEIPRNEKDDYRIFDEDSGKIIVDKYQLCFNKSCKDGKEHICRYLQGGHVRPIEHDVIGVITILCLITPFILCLFPVDPKIVPIPIILLMLLLIPFAMIFEIRNCGRCGHKNSYVSWD